jgi:L-asparagine oxygenase
MSPTEANGAENAPVVDYNPPTPAVAHGSIRITRTGPSVHSSSLLQLEAGEAEQLRKLGEELRAAGADSPERLCEEASLLAAALPMRVRVELARFARNGSDSGYLLLRGLSVDDHLPPTPADSTSHLGESTALAAVQAIVGHCLGEMVAYEAEGGGRLFQDMVPSRDAVNSQTSLSSGVELELHTEQAFSRLRPDWIGLGCLRGAADAATYVLAARPLLAAFESAERALLRQPLWTTQVDESFRAEGREFADGNLRGPFPIVAGSQGDPYIRFDQDLDWGVSKEAEALRRRIVELYPLLRASHRLVPGELLFVDNLRAVHGRSPFRARFDGSDRFIVRSFVVRDLARSRHARPGNGRTIAARFS